MWASNDAKITASFEDDNMIYIAAQDETSLTLGKKNSAQLILSYSSNRYSTIQTEGKLFLKDNCEITDSKYCAIYVKQGDFEMQDFKSEIKPTSNVQVNKPVHEANPSKILDQISKQLDKLQHNSKVNIVLNPISLPFNFSSEFI